MTKKLSQATEKTVLAAIQDVVDHVNGGDRPTDAVIKVAKQANLNPNFVKLICAGYNRGATAFQRDNGEGAMGKLASFPLASAEDVIAAIWPQDIAEKASQELDDEYSQPLQMRGIWQDRKAAALRDTAIVKMAGYPWTDSEEQEAPLPDFNHVQRQVHGVERMLLRKRSEYTNSQDDLLAALGALSDHLKQASSETLSYIENAARCKFGAAGKAVMKYAVNRNKQQLGTLTLKQAAPVIWSEEPYSLIERCVKVAEHMVAKRAEFKKATEVAQQRKEALLRPFAYEVPDHNPPDSIFAPREKRAAGYWTPFMVTQAAKSLGEKLVGDSEARQKKIIGMAEDLDDPLHESHFNEIRAQGMLHDLLTSDEVISGYPPEQVFRAYNDLAAMSPRAALQPTVVRGWLRKNLTQGGVEPFEAKEMTDVEKSLGDVKSPFKEMDPLSTTKFDVPMLYDRQEKPPAPPKPQPIVINMPKPAPTP